MTVTIPTQDPFEDCCRKWFPSLDSLAGSIVMILLVALLWRLLTFAAPEPLGYDESVYRAYAQLIAERGLDGIREAARIWPQHEVLNKGSLPYRIGYLLPCVWGCWLLGGYTAFNLAVISLFFGLATVVVSLLLARRWAGPVYGFFTSLLVVFSPLGTLLSRRALQDTCFALVIALSLLVFDRCWRERRSVDVWVLSVVLWIGFLTKESMLFLYPAYFFMALCYARDGWRDKWHIAIPFVVAPLLHLLVVVWLSGNFQVCLDNYRAYAALQRQIPYAVKYQQGPWFRYLVDWTLLSPLVVVFAIIGAAEAPRHVRKVLVFMLGALAVMSCIPILNVRFILFLDPCLRLLTALGVVAVAQRVIKESRDQCLVALLLMAVIAGSEMFQFYRIFEGAGVYDPVTAELIRANGFVR